ncbi:hypothetical protein EJ02DRAFT_346171, partial [Clathrospora elynae]
MPSPVITALKRARKAHSRPSKRRKIATRGTESHPVDIDASQLVKNNAPEVENKAPAPAAVPGVEDEATFESQLRESQPKDAIVAPTEDGSEAATATNNEDTTDDDVGGFDDNTADNFDGINWTRLPLYMKPLATQTRAKS